MKHLFSYSMKKLGLIVVVMMATLMVRAQNSTLDARIRNNLYLNVYVNKTTCYVGEPIVVTYKLYSSLESVSEITKDPEFRGFELRDLVGSTDDVVSRQTIDGKSFDVHTIRKVQLTPTEAGKLVLDAMTLSNRVKLVDNSGNRSSLLDGIDDNIALKNGDYRISIASVPININVLDAPANAKPATVYNGAAGDFKMNVHLSKVNLTPGEQGILQITISGTGDFSQVTQPLVEWPADVTAATPQVLEQYDRNNKTAPGMKVFSIPFSAVKTGSYTILPIKFSYFDGTRNRHNTVSNPPVTFYVRPGAVASANKATVNDQPEHNDNYGALLVGLGVVVLLIVIGMLVGRAKKKKKPEPPAQSTGPLHTQPTPVAPLPHNPNPDVDGLLQPAEEAVAKPGNSFYSALRQGMIHFFEQKYQVPAKLFYKSTLKDTMTEKAVPEYLQNEVFHMLTEIEMSIYSAGGLTGDRVRMLEKTKAILKKL
ncbi:MAG: BatD family protein [Niabella sp.]|nr:BatD family protein [Niabella sp.]